MTQVSPTRRFAVANKMINYVFATMMLFIVANTGLSMLGIGSPEIFSQVGEWIKYMLAGLGGILGFYFYQDKKQEPPTEQGSSTQTKFPGPTSEEMRASMAPNGIAAVKQENR